MITHQDHATAVTDMATHGRFEDAQIGPELRPICE